MADKVVPGPVEGSAAVREAVCIHTRKIFDSCRDKDCVEDLRVYPTACSQAKLDCALSVRPRSAELLCADVHVKEITFNKGYYTVDVTYFYRVRGETFPGCEPVCGLAIFDKRVMLFGSQASAKVFASDDCCCDPCENGLPIGVVESVDPIALHMKLVDCGSSSGENAGDLCGKYLAGRGRSAADLLILTHYHDDHANGVEQLLELVRFSAVVLPDPSLEENGATVLM